MTVLTRRRGLHHDTHPHNTPHGLLTKAFFTIIMEWTCLTACHGLKPSQRSNMSQTDIAPDSAPAAEAAVNSKVRVTLENGQVVTGVIVEDFGELMPSDGAIEATIDAERGAARLRRFAINTERGVMFGDPDTVEVIA